LPAEDACSLPMHLLRDGGLADQDLDDHAPWIGFRQTHGGAGHAGYGHELSAPRLEGGCESRRLFSEDLFLAFCHVLSFSAHSPRGSLHHARWLGGAVPGRLTAVIVLPVRRPPSTLARQ